MQCTRCQDYGHPKSYCTRSFNCVKCGGPHDTTTCKKARDTPAKCVLYDGNHPANYKVCTVYRDLINSRNKDNPRKTINLRITHNIPHQPTNCAHPTTSYAQITTGRPQTQTTNNHNTDATDQLTIFLNELKHVLNELKKSKQHDTDHAHHSYK